MFNLRYDGAPANAIDLSLDSLLEESIGFRDVINKVNPADPTTWTLPRRARGSAGSLTAATLRATRMRIT